MTQPTAGLVQIAGRDRLQVGVQFDLQRIAGRDLDADDLVVRYVEQVFDDGAQRVAVGGDQHVLAGLQSRRDGAVPIGQDAVQGGLQALGIRNVLTGVTGIGVEIPLAALFQRRRGDVVDAAPDLDLILAVKLRGLGLVQPGQAAVVALVQPPVLDRRHVLQARGLQGQGAGAFRPGQDGGEHHRRPEARLRDQFPAAPGLGLAFGRQVDVDPAGEAAARLRFF
jgi:hypothetical protein